MTRAWVFALAVLAPSIAWSQNKVDLNTINRVEVKGGTVEIHGTRKANFTTFSMSDPPRLVIDISEAVFSGVPEEIQVGNGTITAIKTASYGSQAAAIARVLIGFEREVETDLTTAQGKLVVKVLGQAPPPVAEAPPPPPPADEKAAQAEAAQRLIEEKKAQELAAKAEAERLRREKEEAAAAAKAEAEARAKVEAEAKAAEKAAKAEAARLEREAAAKAEAEAKAQAKADAEAKRRAEAEARAQAKAEQEAAARAAAEAKAKERAEREAAAKAEAEARAQAKAEQEAAARAAAEAKAKERAEREAAAKAEAEAKAKEQAERAAQAKAAQEAAAAEKAARAEAARAEAARAKAERPAAAQADANANANGSATSAAGDKLTLVQGPPPAPSVRPAVGDSGKHRMLTFVGFKQDPGATRIYLRTTEPVQYAVSQSDDTTIVVTLENTRISQANNARALDTSFFDTPVATVTPGSGAGQSVRVSIKLKANAPYRTRQEGNELYVDFPRP